MKSVIAQGATVSKAVDEALKKAGSPKEFFIKILQEAQSGFLGFGSVKAKIALFFKKEESFYKESSMVSRGEYKKLFNNKSLQKKVEQQEKDEGSSDTNFKKPQHKHKQASRPSVRQSKHKVGSRALEKKKEVSSVRTIKTRPLRSNAGTVHKVEELENKNQERPNKAVASKGNQRRVSSERRSRQGSRWGSGRAAVKKNEDKGNTE